MNRRKIHRSHLKTITVLTTTCLLCVIAWIQLLSDNITTSCCSVQKQQHHFDTTSLIHQKGSHENDSIVVNSNDSHESNVILNQNHYHCNAFSETIRKASTCASWIPNEKRRVLFVELYTWKKYYTQGSRTTGEYYLSASWDYALRQLGFVVDRVSHSYYYEQMTFDEINKYYRIFLRDPKWHKRFYHQHDVLCKVRPMYYFGDWYQGKNTHNEKYKWPFDTKQILTAHPEEYNTFLGYFPHNLLLQATTNSSSSSSRGKIGLLYGKKAEYFEPHKNAISALLKAGFELHTTCKDEINNSCSFPPEVIRHENIGPHEYAVLMQKFSFMLGFGKPLVSVVLCCAFKIKFNGGYFCGHKTN